MGKGLSTEDNNNDKMGESYDPSSISELTNLTNQQKQDFGIQKGIQTSSKF